MFHCPVMCVGGGGDVTTSFRTVNVIKYSLMCFTIIKIGCVVDDVSARGIMKQNNVHAHYNK